MFFDSRRRRRELNKFAPGAPQVGTYLLGAHEVTGEILEEILRCSENDHKEYETGKIPLPGTPLIRPVERPVQESADHALLRRFLMISERSLMAAGRRVSKKMTRMYFAGNSFPRYAMIK